MDDQSFPRAVPTQQQTKKPKTLIILVLFLLLLGGVLFAGSRLLGTDQPDEEVESANVAPTAIIAPSDTPAPSEEVTPTPNTATTPTKGPTPTTKKTATSSVDQATGLDRSSLSIEVLNGSGTAGVASKMSTFLKDLGYTVSSTGNADNYDYQSVTVRVKSSESKFLPLLKKDLQGSYTVGETSSALASGSADAVVIIGK